MQNVHTYLEPKEVSYNISVCKYVTVDVSEYMNEDVNEDELVSENVNNN